MLNMSNYRFYKTNRFYMVRKYNEKCFITCWPRKINVIVIQFENISYIWICE